MRQYTDEEIRAQSRELAETVSSGLSVRKLAEFLADAQRLAVRFRESCKNDIEAAVVATAFLELLATVQTTPLQDVGDLIETGIATYGILAGVLAGAFGETVNSQPDDDEIDVPENLIGRYL